MRYRSVLIVAGVAVACAGCASIREGYSSFRESFASWREAFWRDAFEDPARVDRITTGTSRQGVRELLGEPHQQKTLNGEETWTYKAYRTIAKAYLPLSNAKDGSMQSL